MYTMEEWTGGVDELTLEFQASIVKTPLLPENVDFGEGITVIDPTEETNNDNDSVFGTDVVDWEWDTSVEKADRYDYLMAVCSGTIAGLIDVFYVGEFSLSRANEWGNLETNWFVMKIAELQGFKGDDLSDAIKYLENLYRFAADSVTSDFGGGLQHHLRDFSHHFSLGGLVCSIFTQFSGKVIGTDTSGSFIVVELQNRELLGTTFEEKLLLGVIHWFFHMVSDMDGSSATAGKGTGIPGPILSTIKELSALPFFRDRKVGEHEFHVWVSKLFNGTLLATRDENGKIVEPSRFNLRTEIGALHEIGRLCIPVLINECVVRGLYFIRRLCIAFKETEICSITDLKKINPSSLLPFNNRIIKRMVTIASGTFTVIDSVDAAVRATIVNSGYNYSFSVNLLIHINFAGIGRFLTACLSDSKIITEDIREAKAKRDRLAKDYEKSLAGLKCLFLNYEQMRALFSLERLIVLHDINSGDDESANKALWELEWEKQTLKNQYVDSDMADDYFFSLEELCAYIEKEQEKTWIYLMALEALCFVPYFPLNEYDEKEKKHDKMKCKTQFLVEEFYKRQNQLNKDDFISLKNAYQDAYSILTGNKKVVTIASLVVSGVAAWTGKWYYYSLADQLFRIAYPEYNGSGLVGFGLLSFIEELSAGGDIGMLDGLMFAMAFKPSADKKINIQIVKENVLTDCCKTLTFCKEVLIRRFNDLLSVEIIKNTISTKTMDIQKQLEAFQSLANTEKNAEKKKNLYTLMQIAKDSIKYLNRTIVELDKILASRKEVALLQ